MARDDFNNKIKFTLAERAGYECSICRKRTVGPSRESIDAVNLTGVAAHITAASPGGRRYDDSLTSVERSNIENGIWLCTTHGDYIDGDELTYTVEFLKTIKKNHEQKIEFEQSGIRVEKGIITKVEISNFALITNTVSVEFGDLNILAGNNAVGKTLICEFIASLSDKTQIARWVKHRKKDENSFCDIFFFKNQLDKFSIRINRKHELSYSFNDLPIPLLIPSVHVFYLKESYWHFLNKIPEEVRDKMSLTEGLAQYFQLSESEFINTISSLISTKKYIINDLNFDESQEGLIVKINSHPKSPMVPFEDLSGGEQERVILEIALKLATYYAKFTSTILIIENGSFETIDKEGINHLFDSLRVAKLDFQFFFVTVNDHYYDIKDFKINRLIKSAHGNVIVQ